MLSIINSVIVICKQIRKRFSSLIYDKVWIGTIAPLLLSLCRRHHSTCCIWTPRRADSKGHRAVPWEQRKDAWHHRHLVDRPRWRAPYAAALPTHPAPHLAQLQDAHLHCSPYPPIANRRSYWPDRMTKWVERPSVILGDWGIRTSHVRTLVESNKWLIKLILVGS